MIRAEVEQQLKQYTAEKKWYRHLSQRAGVCIILAEQGLYGEQHVDELSLLMMQRAAHPNDPWSGQMAFPGGKQDPEDQHITATAQREAFEEMQIPISGIERIGRLSDILARPYRAMKKPMVVSPLLFKANADFHPEPNKEVADWLWIPVSHFQDDANRQFMRINKAGLEHQLPCYDYKDKRVWGLSLLMIDELLKAL